FSFILCSILFLQLENQIVKSTTTVGESVFLKCPRDNKFLGSLLWIRLVSGTFPEFLFGTRFGMKSNVSFVPSLFIDNYMNSAAATQDSGSDESLSGPSVTLRCSVLRPLGNKTYTDGHKVYWFRSGTDEAHPSFIYAHEECQKVKKDSVQKCFYAFSKNLSSSDAGTYSCAVAACGEIFTGRAREITKKGKHFVFSIINCVLSCVNYFFCFSAFLIQVKILPWSSSDLYTAVKHDQHGYP
uniref:Ig-like domain-containing protein n=1 Tax=Hippocampus comes TaxID=109280 RepID=A0A3Q2Y5Y1_HIPCM